MKAVLTIASLGGGRVRESTKTDDTLHSLGRTKKALLYNLLLGLFCVQAAVASIC